MSASDDLRAVLDPHQASEDLMPDLRGPLDPIMETSETTILEANLKQAKKQKRAPSKRPWSNFQSISEERRTLSPRTYIPSVKKLKTRPSPKVQRKSVSPRP